MYIKLTGRHVQVTWSLKCKTFIRGRYAAIPVKFGKYFRQVKTTPIEMLSKSFFTLPGEYLKTKYESEELLGHALRYHGDVNLKNTIG